VPGPPDALADRVWVAVEAALVPDYADEDAWRVPDSREGEDPLGWEGFNAVPVDEHHVPPVREARRVGTTLVVGAGALAALLAVAALTAPRGDDGSSEPAATQAVAPSTLAGVATTPAGAPPESAPPGTGPGSRGQQPPAEPDLVINPAKVPPHQADRVDRLIEENIGPTPPKLADLAVIVRVWGGSSRVVVRRVEPDGTSEVWLVRVSGDVRRNRGVERDMVEAWAIDSGGVVVTMRVAGDPDTLLAAGLRPGGGGTWLRLPDGADPVFARPDGSLLCMEPRDEGGFELTTYRVLSSAN
jgi:hypothetical protein